MIALIISIIALIVASASLYFIIKLNAYFDKVERKIQDSVEITENLKQSFRDILIDKNYLLDSGKLKKEFYQQETDSIINGKRYSVTNE